MKYGNDFPVCFLTSHAYINVGENRKENINNCLLSSLGVSLSPFSAHFLCLVIIVENWITTRWFYFSKKQKKSKWQVDDFTRRHKRA